MKPLATRTRRLILAATLLVLVFAGTGLLFVLSPPPPAVTVIPISEAWAARKPSLLNRLKARLPMWVWKVKYSLFGPVDTILLDNAIVDFKNWSEAKLSDKALGNPTFTDTNGLRVWIVGQSELKELLRRIEEASGNAVVSSRRMSLGLGIEGQMAAMQRIYVRGGPVDVGVSINFVARARRDGTQLDSIIVASEPVNGLKYRSVQTNLALAARFQIPKGSGVFLIDAGRSVTNGSRYGVMIFPTLLRAKR